MPQTCNYLQRGVCIYDLHQKSEDQGKIILKLKYVYLFSSLLFPFLLDSRRPVYTLTD